MNIIEYIEENSRITKSTKLKTLYCKKYCKNLNIFAETGSYADEYCKRLFS